jgi:hypothetical protein
MADDKQNNISLSFTETQLRTLRTTLTDFLTIDSGDYLNAETTDIINSVIEQIDSTILPPKLSELLRDTPLDSPLNFSYLSTAELNGVYKKLLAIGKDNDLTVSENTCLHNLVLKSGKMLMNRGDFESVHEVEPEAEQGEEI